jgi:hypothetical protein
VSYSDATPDSPVPNPPLIQAIEADVPGILAALGLTDLLSAWNAGKMVTAEDGSGQAMTRGARWYCNASYHPAAATTGPLLLNVVDFDPDLRLTPSGTGTFNYICEQDGYYLLDVHVMVQNGTTSELEAVVGWLDGTTLIAQDPNILPVPSVSGFQSCQLVGLYHLSSGSSLSADFFCTPVAPLIVGDPTGTDTYAFVTRIA